MKRLLTLLTLIALLLTSLAFPVYAVNEMPDDIEEKPGMIEHDDAWIIYDGEDVDRPLTFSASCANRETVDLDGDLFTVFDAPGDKKLIEIKALYLNKSPISIEDYDFDDLALRIQIYVSDPTVFQSNNQIELTSSGSPDQLELNFSPLAHFNLKQGWNSLYLPFAAGGQNKGQLDVTNINYMRMYFFLTGPTVMAIDNMMIVPTVDVNTQESFSTDSSLKKWTAEGATVSYENQAMKLEGSGAFSLTSSAYATPIFTPSRAPIVLRFSASAADALRSLSVVLKDENGSEAKGALTPDESGTTYQVVCDTLDCDDDYNFELTKTVTLKGELSGTAPVLLDEFSIRMYDTDYWMDWCYGYETQPGEYSIAVIPDIQELSAKYPHKLNTIAQWIVENKEKENILFAIDLGDVTWNGHTGDTASSNTEFQNARNAFDLLQEAGIDYSIAYGNHDYTPSGRNTTMFNQYFPLELFQGFDSYGGTRNEKTSDNTYYTFKGGNTDYLVLALEYNPDNATISWADEIVTAHPDHKVIVTTHGYLQGDSAKTVAEENALAPAVGADRLWNQLLKKHENILMLLCGHAWSKSYSGDLVMRQDKGEHGNTVYQIMANAQDIDDTRGGVGMLLMMRFSEDGNVIDFHWFSPVNGETFREKNQFALAIENEFSISGLEDGGAYCGPVTFTVNSKTTVTVKSGSRVLEADNGVYTLQPSEKKQHITVLDPFGKRLALYSVTVNTDHVSEQSATCTALPVCEICGKEFGTLAPHTFGEDHLCTACGAEDATASIPENNGGNITLVLVIIGAAVLVGATITVLIVLKKKKSA